MTENHRDEDEKRRPLTLGDSLQLPEPFLVAVIRMVRFFLTGIEINGFLRKKKLKGVTNE